MLPCPLTITRNDSIPLKVVVESGLLGIKFLRGTFGSLWPRWENNQPTGTYDFVIEILPAYYVFLGGPHRNFDGDKPILFSIPYVPNDETLGPWEPNEQIWLRLLRAIHTVQFHTHVTKTNSSGEPPNAKGNTA